MARLWDERHFENMFRVHVCGGTFQETPEYYERYKARYRDVLRLYASIAPEAGQRVLDVGGGQLALMCRTLWGDEAEAADIDGPHLEYLRASGVRAFVWNLLSEEQPVRGRYDDVFFSEVIEHLPVPGYVALEKLRMAMKPGARLICTTPNLYRPRNVVFLAIGLPIFDHFRYPQEGGLGHVLEYSREHLEWQLTEAGFRQVRVRYVQVGHTPYNRGFRVLQWLGSPLFRIARLRDNLFAIAVNPATTTEPSLEQLTN